MKAIKSLGYFIFIIAITLLLSELVCRIFGLKPYHVSEVKFDYKPSVPGKFDSILGHSLIPGYFTITKNDTFTYHATHNNQCRRITAPDSTVVDDKLGKVIILGCSFTYGDCLPDSSTHPFILQGLFQKSNIDFRVENWGVGGYAPSQFFLQCNDILPDTSIKYVIINYASFQDERTICSRSWRKSLTKHVNQAKYQKQVVVPYFTLQNEAPVLKYRPLEYNFLPFQKHLALVELIDNLYCAYENKRAANITTKVIQLTIDKLQQRGIKVILASINGDDKSNEVVESFAKKGYNTLLYGINTGNNEYNLNPIDGHPNYKANQIFADSIYAKICASLKP